MDAEHLLGTIIRGALSGRRKPGRRAVRYLTGGSRSMVSASTLMTLAGLAWGLWESASAPKTPGPVRPTPAGSPPPVGPRGGGVSGAGVPGSRAPGAGEPPPAPPSASGSGAPAAPGSAPAPVPAGIPPGVVRLVRLTISAARADGTLGEEERAAIMARAREAGVESMVDQELRAPRPLSEIVAGVTDLSMRRDLYALAFGIVRADASVTGAERIYLAQLAALLGIDRETAGRLEADTAAQIDAQPDGEAEMRRPDTAPPAPNGPTPAGPDPQAPA